MKKDVFLGQLKMNGKNIKWVVSELAKHDVEVTESTVYKKLRGDSEFTAPEIKAISKIMGYSKEEMYDIFFEELVS